MLLRMENWIKELDRKTRKLLTMHNDYHLKRNVDRHYVSRKGGTGLMNCEKTAKR